MTSARQTLLAGILAQLDLSAQSVASPGTTVVSTEGRRGSGLAAIYQIDQHTVVWCDPDIEGAVAGLQRAASTSAEEMTEWADAAGYESPGGSVMKTLSEFFPAPVPADLRVHRFDWNRPGDLDLVRTLVDLSSEEDLDEAEIELDDLDDASVGLIDREGALVAYAGMRPFDFAPELGDIGVLVRHDARRRGLGGAVVSALIEVAMPAGWKALYRCDAVANPGSDLLSAKIGFEPVVDLLAFQITDS